jgi:hypothetical protein
LGALSLYAPRRAAQNGAVLKWVPLAVACTVALFFWFVVAFFSDNNFEWYTSQFVQIVTGVGTLVGIAITIALIATASWQWVRHRLSRR